MNKKDYIKLAQAIRENTINIVSIHSNDGFEVIGYRNEFLTKLCDILAKDNSKFDKSKFMEAVK